MLGVIKSVPEGKILGDKNCGLLRRTNSTRGAGHLQISSKCRQDWRVERTMVKASRDRESLWAFLEKLWASTKPTPGPCAARSQDFLYDEDGLPLGSQPGKKPLAPSSHGQ